MINKKIKSQSALVKIVKNLKRRGKKIVTFSGSFDVLHIGHIKSLEEAKRQGDILIILLNSDKSVRGYKGPNRPINLQKDRAEMLAALECVDYVVIFDELNVKKMLSKTKPHVLCHGVDWGKNCIERKTVEDYGGRIHVTKWTKNFSTSNLIKKILKTYSEPVIKAIFIDTSKKGNRKIFQKLSKGYKIYFGHLNIKMLMRLVKKFGISLNDSWIISDKENGVIIGREVNAKTIKIGDKLSKNLKLEPHYYASSFKKAMAIVIGNTK